MFDFLKRKKKEEKKFEPRVFKFYDTDAKILYRLYDEYKEKGTKRSRYVLWDAMNKKIPDVNIADDGNWEMQTHNALVFTLTETEI